MTPTQIEQTYRGIVKSERIRVRNETIEECARVAEHYKSGPSWDLNTNIAAAIRALRDKP